MVALWGVGAVKESSSPRPFGASYCAGELEAEVGRRIKQRRKLP